MSSAENDQAVGVSRYRAISWAVVSVLAVAGFGWSLRQLGGGFEARFASIKPGATPQEVRQILGEPTGKLEAIDIRSPVEQKLHERLGIGYEGWVYCLGDDFNGPKLCYVVLFDREKVARTEKQIMPLP